MATQLRKTNPLVALIATIINSLKIQAGPRITQRGTTAAMTAGAITVSSVEVLPGSFISLTAHTPGGTQGDLSATTRTNGLGTGGSFAIASSSGSDTSTVDWMLTNTYPHLDASEVTAGSATATDLATSLALINELAALFYGPASGRGPYPGHINDALAHKAVDAVDTLSAAFPVSTLAAAITLANELKADYNAHRTSTTYHHASDSINSISSADATDQSSLNTLVNELKSDINAHVILAPPGAMVRAVDG